MTVPTQDPPKFAYMRQRPFLVIEHFKKPSKGVHTERKGWMKVKAAVSIDENPLIVDRISDKHLVGASVIIDLINDTVIKNRLSDSNEETLKHFKARYADIIEQGKSRWVRSSLRALSA